MLSEKKRDYGLDLLKIISFLCVVTVHVLSPVWHELPANTLKWQLINGLRNTWCVPVFVMISGCFLLNPEKEMPAKKLGKYFLRIVGAFLFFSVFYKSVEFIQNRHDPSLLTNWKWQIIELFDGEYHLWYLPMLAGLYLITPFLRKIAEDRKLMEWYLVLFFAFEFLMCYGVQLPKVGVLLQPLVENMEFHFALGYSGYFVMGYYLYTRDYSLTQERLLYLAGILCLLVGIGGNSVYALVVQEKTTRFTDLLTPNLIVVAAAVFVFFKQRVSLKSAGQRTLRWISLLESLSFGAYLIHALFVGMAADFLPITGETAHPLLLISLETALVSAASLISTYAWKKISSFGKMKRK